MSVSLSSSQLEKPYHSNHELYGLYQDRGERFLDKIIKKEPFELTDGSFSTISECSPGVLFLIDKKYNELSGGKKLFIVENNIFLSLSQFKKTVEFGAGGGQGGGSKNTALQESTQCVFNALSHIKKDNIDNLDITYENISSSYQYCQTSTTLNDVYEFAQNPSWRQSFLTSSNILYSYVSESNYTHHRDSPLINDLYSTYNKSSANYQSDKWNPSDIWFVKDSALNTRFSCSIDELNDQIKDMFINKELIGVSLKKVGKETKLEVKNMDKINKKQYEYLGYKTTGKSKDMSLLYDGGKICFRTFNFATNWAGEILGKTASHGKVGFGPINTILSKFDIQLKTAKEIKLMWEEDKEYAELALFTFMRDFVGVEEPFNIFIQDKNIDWKVSKLLGLSLLSIIQDQPKYIQNKIITEIISYASSELDDSSVFLKLS